MIKNCGRPERFTDIIFDNCRKILVRGNHDKKSTPYYLDAGFTLVVD